MARHFRLMQLNLCLKPWAMHFRASLMKDLPCENLRQSLIRSAVINSLSFSVGIVRTNRACLHTDTHLETALQAWNPLLQIHLHLVKHKPHQRQCQLARAGQKVILWMRLRDMNPVRDWGSHVLTCESNLPALCRKVMQISWRPRISQELFSKHSNTPQPTSPALTRQCWISAVEKRKRELT